MGHSGAVEFLCPDGHHWEVDDSLISYWADCGKPDYIHCTGCGKRAVLAHAIDDTNGTEEAEYDPECHTRRSPLTEVGFDDKWQNDHYGTKYATKMIKYVPVHKKHWQEVTPDDYHDPDTPVETIPE